MFPSLLCIACALLTHTLTATASASASASEECSLIAPTTHSSPHSLTPPLPHSHTQCSSGHWPLKKACKRSHSGIYYDPATHSLTSEEQVSEQVSETVSEQDTSSYLHTTWNITHSPTHSHTHSPLCSTTVPRALFMPIAYDTTAYQTQGSNYYVTHTDTLIPLWNFLTKLHKSTPSHTHTEVFLFAFNVEGKVDLISDAFDDYSKYWIQSLQLLLGDIPLHMGTLSGLHHYLTTSLISESERVHETVTMGSLCFGEVFFGVPQFIPTARATKRFSLDYRKVLLLSFMRMCVYVYVYVCVCVCVCMCVCVACV